MTFPTIHLNGTNADDLLNGYMDAASSVREATDAVASNAGPNGRDYYVKGPAEFEKARAEHEQRIWKLREVLAEIEEIMQNIVTQQEERDARKQR